MDLFAEHFVNSFVLIQTSNKERNFLVHLSRAEGSSALLWSRVVRRPSSVRR